MKKLLIAGNWKSYKTVSEAHSFMIEFLNKEFITWLHSRKENEEVIKNIIIFPPFTLLPELAKILHQVAHSLPLSLGSQDISPFAEGAHTGEESARQVSEFAKYVIIGHSERRKEFGETDELLSQKVKAAREFQLEPIFCVQSKDTYVPDTVHILAYEPLDAISTGGIGKAADPESAESVAQFYKHERHIPYVLYGGSVNPDNVHSYTSQPSIDGVLVGSESLTASHFSRIIQKA